MLRYSHSHVTTPNSREFCFHIRLFSIVVYIHKSIDTGIFIFIVTLANTAVKDLIYPVNGSYIFLTMSIVIWYRMQLSSNNSKNIAIKR